MDMADFLADKPYLAQMAKKYLAPYQIRENPVRQFLDYGVGFEFVTAENEVLVSHLECIGCYDHFSSKAELQDHFCIHINEQAFLMEHTEQFTLFDNARKWKLRSGRNVEDVLHAFAKKCTHEHAAHSFILNPLDPTWEQLKVFTKEELHEMATFRSRKLPPLPDELALFINDFKLTNIKGIREALWRQRDFDMDFDRNMSFDKDWVRNVVHSILMELEAGQLSQNHLEPWLISHVWSTLDRCFGDLDSVNVVRGESTSSASGLRKNESRIAASTSPLKRLVMGHRADFLIRKLQTEYACGESGKSYTGEKDTKLLLERDLKMPKMLKDQLLQLFKLCNNDENSIRKLATTGILQYGLHSSVILLDCPSGYVCRVSSTPTYKIPTSITTFPRLLHVIELTWKSKALVRSTISEVEGYNDDEDVDFTSSRYRTPSPSPSSKRPLYIPYCVSTP
ncbi:hypothetical protein BC943DRAFT_355189 [Umbelopsis sp. AD052]|nr:hypothetical protein BC943DRAFT_355189 [Umbelopsis sp. AD052]